MLLEPNPRNLSTAKFKRYTVYRRVLHNGAIIHVIRNVSMEGKFAVTVHK